MWARVLLRRGASLSSSSADWQALPALPALATLAALALASQPSRDEGDGVAHAFDLRYRPSNNIPDEFDVRAGSSPSSASSSSPPTSSSSASAPTPTIAAPSPSPTTGVISSPIYDARASEAALDAARTIDDIEGAGFRVLGLLGTGAFGSVYSAEVVANAGWAEHHPGVFTRSVQRMHERKVRDGMMLPADGGSFNDGFGGGGVRGDDDPADHDGLDGLDVPRPLRVPRGVRVAVKRMAKGTRLRPVDADDYEGTEAHPADASSPPGRSAADVAFQREVVALRAAGYAGVHHPHIGNLLGTFETESSHYIVLELVEGLPLFDWIVEHGVFFREETASAALRQVVDALVHIHARHICHNDIKPENILVSRVARAQMGARGGNPDDVEGKLNTVPGRAFGATAPITNEDVTGGGWGDSGGGGGGGRGGLAAGNGVEGGGRSGGSTGGGGRRGGSMLTLKVIDFGMAHVLSGRGRRGEEEEGVILDRRRGGVHGEEQDEEDGVIRNGSSRGGLRRALTNNSSLHSTIEGGPGEGTFAYWAPEMMCGERYGVAVDMWALGVTLYIALCGVHPFDPKGVRRRSFRLDVGGGVSQGLPAAFAALASVCLLSPMWTFCLLGWVIFYYYFFGQSFAFCTSTGEHGQGDYGVCSARRFCDERELVEKPSQRAGEGRDHADARGRPGQAHVGAGGARTPVLPKGGGGGGAGAGCKDGGSGGGGRDGWRRQRRRGRGHARRAHCADEPALEREAAAAAAAASKRQ